MYRLSYRLLMTMYLIWLWYMVIVWDTYSTVCMHPFSSLNTQRSCLLENNYVHQECGGPEKEELYRNVSAVFLATWCKLPLPPYMMGFSSAPSSHHIPSPLSLLLFLLYLLVKLCWRLQSLVHFTRAFLVYFICSSSSHSSHCFLTVSCRVPQSVSWQNLWYVR